MGIILSSTQSSCLLDGNAQNMSKTNQHRNYPYFLVPGPQSTDNPFRSVLARCPVVQMSKGWKLPSKMVMS